MPANDQDLVLPFQLESSLLRGRLVRMDRALDTILSQHSYPLPVATLLAETTVVAAALASSLKYEGVFTLQAKGDGAVRLLVADITSSGGVRAYAQFDADKIGAQKTDTALLGKGFMAFTCAMSGSDDRYQGIVELQGDSIAAAVQYYFRQSEQIPTGLVAAVRRDDIGGWRGGAILLQRMPSEGGINVERPSDDTDDWTRAMVLMNSCTPAELTSASLDGNDLLFRLFHEEGVRVYAPKGLKHQCRCSHERVESMLKSLPRDEVEQLAVEGVVSVTCEFCNKSYIFDAATRATLWD